MKFKQSLLQTAMFATPLLLAVTGLSVTASENQPPTPDSMECVEVSGFAGLKEDLDCKIANSHHRQEQYPESNFIYDEMPEACSDPEDPMICCVKGQMWGTIGDYDFAAGAGCGFTFNDLAEETALDLEAIGYQQFTARTLIRVFLNTTEVPEPPDPEDETEVKADFGLFLGDSGVARYDQFVSQRMVLTGARKLPVGTKMRLDMVGVPPVRQISGTLCAPNIEQILDNIAQNRPGGNDDEEDED